MKIDVTWSERLLPLLPTAVFTPQSKTQKLIRCLLSYSDEHLRKLEGLVCAQGILLTGDTENLPWVDGCFYLGKDAAAPHIYMSTLHEPNIPVGLLDSALYRRYEQSLVVLPGMRFLIPIQGTRALERQAIQELIQ